MKNISFRPHGDIEFQKEMTKRSRYTLYRQIFHFFKNEDIFF